MNYRRAADIFARTVLYCGSFTQRDRLLIAIAIFTLLCAVRQAVAQQLPDLPALARAANDDFQPISTEKLEAARALVSQRAHELEEWMVPGTRQCRGWKRYLEWDRLQAQLPSGVDPDRRHLAAVYRKLNADHPGLEKPQFRRLSEALLQYIDLLNVQVLPRPEETYARQMEALATALEKYESDPHPRTEYEIGWRLDFFSGLGFSPTLVRAVRQRHVQANTFLDFSAGFLAAVVSEPINRTGPVRDCILGTSIYGTSYTKGRVTVRPLPATGRALLEFVSTGHIRSQNKGYNKPIVVRNTGYTDFSASKLVELTDPVFRVLPSSAHASTKSQIRAVSTQRQGPLSGVIAAMGRKRVYESKRCAESIASDHAEQDIRSQFDEEVLKEVRDLRQQYRDEFRYPLLRQGEYPEQVHFSSTSRSMRVTTVQANRGQLGASGRPPSVSGHYDLIARLHQTSASNNAAILLGGLTISESASGEGPQLDRALPAWLEDVFDDFPQDEGDQDGLGIDAARPGGGPSNRSWEITFRRLRPVSVEFIDSQLKLTFHLSRIVSGRDRFLNWDLLATYDVRLESGGLLLTRQGELETLPSGFDPTSGRGLPTRQIPIRNNLNKVINELTEQGDGIPETIEISEIKLPGELADVGPLRLNAAQSGDGWLTLGWNLP